MFHTYFNSLNRHIFSFVLVMAGFLPAFGQEEDPALPYAYRNTLEISIGNARNLKSYSKLVDGGLSQAGANTAGIDFTARYSFFPSRHWGGFIQAEATPYAITDSELEYATRHYYDNKPEPSDQLYWNGGNMSSSYGTFLLGGVYRYDISRWSFRGRVGAGLRRQSNESFSCRTLNIYSGDEYGHAKDYFRAFAYNTSLQCCFTPRRHFFFLAEASWTGTIGHLFQYTEEYQITHGSFNDIVEDPHSPTGYVYAGIPEANYERISCKRQRISMGNFLNIRFGIGWNIGHNRNAKHIR